jgi:hypothetical protein
MRQSMDWILAAVANKTRSIRDQIECGFISAVSRSVRGEDFSGRTGTVRLEALTGDREGQHRITADTALRLAYFFGGDAQTWLNSAKPFC